MNIHPDDYSKNVLNGQSLRFGPDGAGVVAGVEGGDAEDDAVVLKVVAHAVSVRNNGTVPHVRIFQSNWHLNKKCEMELRTSLKFRRTVFV